MPYRYSRRSSYGSRYNRYKRRTWTPRRRNSGRTLKTSKPLLITKNSSSLQTGSRALNQISTGLFKNLPSLWPDKFLCKMKYVDTVNVYLSVPAFTPGSSVYEINYRVNSLWDPLTTTTAEQNIAGYNELAQMYDRYRVLACKATVDITNTNTIPIIASWAFMPYLSTTSTYGQMLTQTGNPFTVWGTATGNAGDPMIHLENYVSFRKLLGSDVVRTDNDYAGTTGANPGNPLYGVLNVSAPGPPNSTTLSGGLIVQLEFWCEWFGRVYATN